MAEIRPLTRRQKLLRWGLWCGALGLWTAALVSKHAPRAVAVVVPHDYRFCIAKTGHVLGYMVLSILVGWLPVRMPLKIAWWLFLVFHAAATEFIQLFVPGRTGRIQDVGLDVIGLLLGQLVLYLFSLRRAR
jgi:VanZ family protein